MLKKEVSICDLVPNMRIAETVLNDFGSVIIMENTVLDEHLIKKLQNQNISKIKVFEETNKPVTKVKEVFQRNYNQGIYEVKNIISEIIIDKDVNMEKVEKVVDSVIDMSDEKMDLIRCLNQIKSSDEYIYTHSMNVAMLSMLIGKWSGYEGKKLQMLVQAALLHDIGKTKVPPEILNKPGKLTEAEYEEMKKHSTYGYRMLEEKRNVSMDICLAVLMHHEREDGSGYPIGAKSDRIHDFAKIIAVADIYDAMTSERVYKERESPFEVFELMEEKTLSQLSVEVVFTFLNNIASYYIGDLVMLDNGKIGEIVHINPRHVSKPIIKVDDKYLDLTVEKHVKIKHLL
ncbi:HD-GYP domain-containing protein [Acetivibrio saccincola]|uniref:Cyclic di-GMP phosphodiesterase response regulator RpfG n=2 Tax=Acetivibrio saccincola TaxID=1677857 RepID=A0A2K9E226_9FIRM|nr:HD-GYP domain-containing protein [Acetivibrio saccincola]AUG57792.1 Cyclic di-GMP phosphodiesterase response regulator RpfG [Acetivibrio saccincola]